MCITEIWTYRECGCSHQRILRCITASVAANNSGLSSLPSFQSLDSTIIRDLGYLPTNAVLTRPLSSEQTLSNIKFTCRRGHRLNHIVNREFLESICDECLLDEIALKGSSNSMPAHHKDKESAVDATVDRNTRFATRMQTTSSPREGSGGGKTTRDIIRDHDTSNRERAVIETFHSSFATSRSLYTEQHHEETPSSTGKRPEPVNITLNTVDRAIKRQQSLQILNSTPSKSNQDDKCERNNRKQWRRRGIDLSREDLRISSRWSSGEKQTMLNFRDALREGANDDNRNAFSIFVKKEVSSRSTRLKNLRSFIGTLRTSMIRSNSKEELTLSKSPSNLDRTEQDIQQVTKQCSRLTSRQEAFRDQYYSRKCRLDKGLRAVEASLENLGLQPPAVHMVRTPTESKATGIEDRRYGNNRSSQHVDIPPASPAILSWENHLRHDLTERSTRKKAAKVATGQSEEFMSSNSNPTMPCSESGIHTSKSEISSRTNTMQSSIHDGDTRQRLNGSTMHPYFRLSIYAPSSDLNSTSYSSNQPLLSERLDDIVSPADFEDNNERAGQWRNLGEINFQSTASLGSSNSSDDSSAQQTSQMRSQPGQIEASQRIQPSFESRTSELAELATTARGVLVDSTPSQNSSRHLDQSTFSKRRVKSQSWPCDMRFIDHEGEDEAVGHDYQEIDGNETENKNYVSIHPIGTRLVHGLSTKKRIGM